MTVPQVIKEMFCPAQSPDLNLNHIQHLWDEFECALVSRWENPPSREKAVIAAY